MRSARRVGGSGGRTVSRAGTSGQSVSAGGLPPTSTTSHRGASARNSAGRRGPRSGTPSQSIKTTPAGPAARRNSRSVTVGSRSSEHCGQTPISARVRSSSCAGRLPTSSPGPAAAPAAAGRPSTDPLDAMLCLATQAVWRSADARAVGKTGRGVSAFLDACSLHAQRSLSAAAVDPRPGPGATTKAGHAPRPVARPSAAVRPAVPTAHLGAGPG